jgi:hypothetical protein
VVDKDDLDVIRLVAMDDITAKEYHRLSFKKRPNFSGVVRGPQHGDFFQFAYAEEADLQVEHQFGHDGLTIMPA